MSGRPRREDGHGRLGGLLSGLAVAVGGVLFLGAFLWGMVGYRPYTVPTNSMQPTVDPGDRVLAQRVPGSAVHRGDVVVFTDPQWDDLPLVKRVVAVGGDQVACCDARGRLLVDGKPVTEPYLDQSGPASSTAFSVRVPVGRLFVLGDNRAVSDDSRAHSLVDGGTVPVGDVDGRVEAVVWPIGRFGAIARTTAFAALPGGTSAPGPLPWLTLAGVVGALLIFCGAAYAPVVLLVRRAGRRTARTPSAAVGPGG